MKAENEASANLIKEIAKFSIKMLQSEETKNNPEMVVAISELLKIGYISSDFKI
ncbi:hypothetical protein Hs30E_19550 [Lactococcus hodotermopsidis]|uniref:Uncharacterized protein n=1 Tax=Pseudolactococcus hodotermopsidis TaxID=2709157 RepID=A0A6A0BFY1_9LACT|nr:hypothetical protein [Lactococcus hodotermopsidis]GFH43404.1 hypothetical protein Hs30E_19550 [Lactococcus hodotermopsidis]